MRIEKRKRDKDMRSDSVKTGTAQAPHRSLFNALGFTEEERRRPMIGIVSSFNEIVPGHMNLDKITEAVKMGVAMAGDRKSTRLNSSHNVASRMPSSA